MFIIYVTYLIYSLEASFGNDIEIGFDFCCIHISNGIFQYLWYSSSNHVGILVNLTLLSMLVVKA